MLETYMSNSATPTSGYSCCTTPLDYRIIQYKFVLGYAYLLSIYTFGGYKIYLLSNIMLMF